jgi:uncharacterized phage protein (TIGR02218 family)
MSFDSLETGIATGKPVRLYLFERGVRTWAYCTADRDIEFSGVTYQGVAVMDDGLRQSGESSADMLTITMPADLSFLDQYRYQAPSDEIFVTVRDLHWPDLYGRVRWSGSVQAVRRTSDAEADVICRSWLAMMDEAGLRQCYGRSCPHTLYDHRCLVSRAAFAEMATVTAVSGRSLTAAKFAALDDGYLKVGYVEVSIGDGLLERYGIELHAGGTIALLDLPVAIAAGSVVTAYPGCDRTITTCDERFNNTANYGGQPHIPDKSPFDGNPVY